MNSTLQALIHTPLLTQYFLHNYHLTHINTTNKDSYQGRLAKAYAKLVYDMCTTSKSEISPKMFYNEFTQLASQFQGHDQHDAQVYRRVCIVYIMLLYTGVRSMYICVGVYNTV